MRVLVLGGTGFVGSHLARACLGAGDEVFITSRARPRIEHPRAPGLRTILCDVRDEPSVMAAVAHAMPERVFHLAGHASVARSFDADEEYLKTNLLGTLHVLRAVRATAPRARLLYVGSAEEYGFVAADRQPITEDEPLRPLTPYGVSRAAASLLAQRFALAEGLHVVRTRSFNHTGAGQTLDFAAPSFADQLVRAKLRGERAVDVLVGDLSVRRDFSGVAAVVEAYRAMLEKADGGAVLNVCSGRAVSLHEILSSLGEIVGVAPRAVPDPARARPVTVPLLVGDPARLRALTGASLEGSLDFALRDLVRDTEERVRREGARP